MIYKIGQRVIVKDTDGVDIWLKGIVYSITHTGKVRVLVDCSGVLDLNPDDTDQIQICT